MRNWEIKENGKDFEGDKHGYQNFKVKHLQKATLLLATITLKLERKSETWTIVSIH